MYFILKIKLIMKNIKIYKSSFFALIFMFSTYSTYAQQTESLLEVDKRKVCMVDDEYKGEQQLLVTIDNKTYYGCCDPCIETLKTDSSFRKTTDYYLGSKIFKADAYIVKKTNNKVLYFKSKESYLAYLKIH
jgi:hypothetical protein